MKIIAASIVIGPLMLMGALPAAAQPVAAPVASTPVRAAPDRMSYTHQARDDMRGWQRKLDHAGARAGADGKDAGAVADNDLDRAWIKAKAASRRLETVGDDGWASAKASYEQASRELADAWDRIGPKDK